jgi:hypothetical protein
MKNSSIKCYISASDDNEELKTLLEESFIGPKKNWTASQLKAINEELPILLTELREEYNDVPNDIGKAENPIEVVLNEPVAYLVKTSQNHATKQKRDKSRRKPHKNTGITRF